MLSVPPNQSFASDAALASENKYPTSSASSSTLWFRSEIHHELWNQSFPYQLMVYDSLTDDFDNKWVFTLPIAPQNLSISVPFANQIEATLGGTISEHNGSPMRSISLSGTTGFFPVRATAKELGNPSAFEGVLAGTVDQLNQLSSAVQTLIGQAPQPNIISNDEIQQKFKSTGYYQFRLLHDFLERFNELKTTSNGNNLHLAFCIYKDEAIYLVETQNFTLRKNAESPLKYEYQLEFTAYARINQRIKSTPNQSYKPTVRDPGNLAKLLNTLMNARKVLFELQDTIRSVIQDVNFVLFEPLRQATLFVKELVGVPLTFADLPSEIMKSCQGAVLNFIAVSDAAQTIPKALANSNQKTVNEVNALINYAKKLGVGDTLNTGINNYKGLSSGGASKLVPFQGTADPANKIFNTLSKRFELQDLLRPGQMNLSPLVIKNINTEREKNKQLKRIDFQNFMDQHLKTLNKFEALVGIGNSTYSNTFSTDQNIPSDHVIEEYYQISMALNDVIQSMASLASSADTNEVNNILNSLNFIAGLATRSGIVFKIPTSKYKVPYIYGITIEKFAEMYLGSPDRWIEIATLNGLLPPYVDEVGFTLPFLTNGNQNQVQIQTSQNLYVGQPVTLVSNSVIKNQRVIEKIDVLNENYTLLSLSGEGDLDKYTTADSAYLHAFLPNTVNSQMSVFIPSDKEPEEGEYITKSIPGIDEEELLFEVGGIDYLLDQNLDLIVTSDGDTRYAVGLNNIIQYTKIILNTIKGTVTRHLNFGLPRIVGETSATVSSASILSSIQASFTDTTLFNGVNNIIVKINGPSVDISMNVLVRGLRTYIPVSFQVPIR